VEALAFVEELGRNGDVIRRHVLEKLPARIGRGYDADVIVDDPHVAANHLEIRLTEDRGLEAVDLGSLNGTSRVGNGSRISTTPVHGNDVFRIGQMQVRIRLPGQMVPSELPIQQRTWDRHPGVFAGSVILLAGILVWGSFVATLDTDSSGIIFAPTIISVSVLIWTATWSLVCRTLHGNSNFWAHGIVAFLGCAVVQLVGKVGDYLDFSLDLDGFAPVWLFLGAGILAGMVYRHLRLTVRSSSRVLGALAVVVVAMFIGGIAGYREVRDANKPGLQSYDHAIKPNAFLVVSGITTAQFLEVTEKLRTKADKEARAIAR
jgi:hypothetical protein